ncbi:MAG: DUF6078 family protein [Bacteroidales bacterium]|nr:DUF6078 family protein [Bacteroidales bacterium]
MEIEINNVPTSWVMCANGECQKTAECLRHIVFSNAPKGWRYAKCMLPAAWADGKYSCFVRAEKVVLAKGFDKGFSSLTSRDARHDIRVILSEQLGSKGTYDRLKKGERLLTRDEMQMIATVFRQYTDFADADIFDELVQTYDFT